MPPSKQRSATGDGLVSLAPAANPTTIPTATTSDAMKKAQGEMMRTSSLNRVELCFPFAISALLISCFALQNPKSINRSSALVISGVTRQVRASQQQDHARHQERVNAKNTKPTCQISGDSPA